MTGLDKNNLSPDDYQGTVIERALGIIRVVIVAFIMTCVALAGAIGCSWVSWWITGN